MTEYTAASRERWREEIRTAKQSMTKEEFKEWLYRKVNTVGQ